MCPISIALTGQSQPTYTFLLVYRLCLVIPRLPLFILFFYYYYSRYLLAFYLDVMLPNLCVCPSLRFGLWKRHAREALPEFKKWRVGFKRPFTHPIIWLHTNKRIYRTFFFKKEWQGQVIDFLDIVVSRNHGEDLFLCLSSTASSYWWICVIWNWIYTRLTIGQTHCGLRLSHIFCALARPLKSTSSSPGLYSAPKRGKRPEDDINIKLWPSGMKGTTKSGRGVWTEKGRENMNKRKGIGETWQQYIYI